MKLLQYKGPFNAGYRINKAATYDYMYVQIGIQVPHIQPIEYYKEQVTPIIEFNGVTYALNEPGILEFEQLAEIAIDIKILKDLPMESLIDIAYKEENE